MRPRTRGAVGVAVAIVVAVGAVFGAGTVAGGQPPASPDVTVSTDGAAYPEVPSNPPDSSAATESRLAGSEGPSAGHRTRSTGSQGSVSAAPGSSRVPNASSETLAEPVVRLSLDWPGRPLGQRYVRPGDRVTLDASESFDPDGEISTYAFDVDLDDDYEVVGSTDPVDRVAYDSEGYRTVRVRVTDDEGDTNTTARTVFVNERPAARFGYAPAPPRVGEQVTFDAGASTDYNGTITGYEWYVNGTRFGSNRLFNVTFTRTGDFNVSLVVFDDEDGGPAGRTRRIVTVREAAEPPEASFSISPRPAIAGNETTLDASNSTDPDGRIVEYRWDFDGDGVVDRNSTDPVTTHEFAYDATGEGYAVVGLTVVDDAGNQGRTSRDLSIRRPAPVARCSVVPDTVAVEETVVIDASASENAESYVYDTDADPGYETDLLGSERYEVSFPEPGNYTLGVEVYGAGGDRTDEADCSVEVTRRPAPTFTVSPRPAVAGEDTVLDASNSTDPDGRIVEYRWDFDGDGVVDVNSTDPVVVHQFPLNATGEGYAVVGLTVVDDDGYEARVTGDLGIVREGPTARCRVDPGVVAVDQPAVINASGSENAASYVYDTDADPEYETDLLGTPRFEVSFGEPGTYTLGVEAYNGSDRTDEADCPLRVTERPRASFSVSPRPAVAGEPATLDASDSADPDGRIVRYRWDFDGDGTVDQNTTDPVTTHRFAYDATGEGYAVVELTVVDDLGIEGSTGADLEIRRPTLGGDCTADPLTVAPGESVTLRVDPTPSVDGYQYDRDSTGAFGNLTSDQSRTVTYDDPGEFEPRVRVWNRSSERTRVVECGTVTVEEPNSPPDASIGATPATPERGDRVVFDAGDSSDADGRVVTYEWDLDGDGNYERSTDRPTASVSESFPDPGEYTVTVRVVDDDGATDTAELTLRVFAPLRAECTISNRAVAPGDEVTLRVEASGNVDGYQFDAGDEDGGFADVGESATATVSYDAPGNYTPRARAWAFPSERSVEVECPTVRVRSENAPPTAAFEFSPDSPNTDDSVTFDAGGSTDPDGRIVEYRWDFGSDGTVEETTTDPTVSRSFESDGGKGVRLVVVDDDGATSEVTNEVQVVKPSSPLPELPVPWWVVPLAILGLGGAGVGLYRLPKRLPKGGKPEAGREFATGTFEAPTKSGTVTVRGVGFEPDALQLRVANGVTAPGSGASAATDGGTTGTADGASSPTPGPRKRTAGRSIGTAVRTGGGIEQTVVSVGDDDRSADGAVGATRDGTAIDVPVYGSGGLASLDGVVESFDDDGFTVSIDAAALPEGLTEEYVVHYQAFSLPDPLAADVGQFRTPTEPGRQTVSLDVDADYVSLTACTLTGEVDSTVTGDAVGICHGQAVLQSDDATDGGGSGHDRAGRRSAGDGAGFDGQEAISGEDRLDPRPAGRSPTMAVDQHVVGAAVTANSGGPTRSFGRDERALTLPFLDDSGAVGETVGRVTGLGEALELSYESVHAPDGDGRVVTYFAVETGDDLRPATGHVEVPSPGTDEQAPLDFDPGFVSVAGVGPRTSPAVPFDWSDGVAMPTATGGVAEQVLHGLLWTEPVPHPEPSGDGLIDPIHAGETVPGGTDGGETGDDGGSAGAQDGGAESRAADGGPTRRPSGNTGGDPTVLPDGVATPAVVDTRSSGPHDVPSARGSCAVIPRIDADGGIYGLDRVNVTSFSPTGFRVRTAATDPRVPTDGPSGNPPAGRGGDLFYVAWPTPSGGRERADGTTDGADGAADGNRDTADGHDDATDGRNGS